VGHGPDTAAGWGDLLVLVGLFALARFALALAALDAAARRWDGQQRDVAISALAEPGLVQHRRAAIAANSTDLGTISALASSGASACSTPPSAGGRGLRPR